MPSYLRLFEHGANFPDTGAMLEATSSANNANVRSLSDNIADISQTGCIKPTEIEAEHLRLRQSSLALFKDMADFGSQRSIQAAREKVLNEIDRSSRLYEKLNESRNPRRYVEYLNTTVPVVRSGVLNSVLILQFYGRVR